MKVPTIIAEAKHALENGQCIVIGLQTTGEVGVTLCLFIPLKQCLRRGTPAVRSVSICVRERSVTIYCEHEL